MRFAIIQHGEAEATYRNLVEYCIISFSREGVSVHDSGLLAMETVADADLIKDWAEMNDVNHVFIHMP